MKHTAREKLVATRLNSSAPFRPTPALVALCATLGSLVACGGSNSDALQTGGSVQAIQISPTNPQVATGQSLQLTAMATYSDGTHADVTTQVSWTSSNSTVATASFGQVVTESAGFATIHASWSGVNAATLLTVTRGGGGLPPGYAYITSANVQGGQVAGAVYQYAIGMDGSLTPLSIASVATGPTPTAVVSDPSGHYVYVANLGDATISQYAVGVDGELMALSPAVVSIAAPFPVPAGYTMSVDPKGLHLYVVTLPRDHSGHSVSIAEYSIGGGGTLTPLSPAYVSVSTAMSAGPLTIGPSGKYAYLAGTTNAVTGQVSQFSIADDGTLSPLAAASVAAAGQAFGVAITPSSRTAYVLSRCVDNACDGQVAEYAIGTNGTLTATGADTVTGSHINPVAMVTDGSGSSAYLLTNFMGVDTNAGAVYQYEIDSAGGLTPDTPVSLSVTSGAVTENTYGPYLYALSSNALGFVSGSPTGGHVDQYSIGSNGLLSAVNAIPVVAPFPTAMTLVVAH
jgi:6-phosphogluconolactonase (cycloisomerase 2 family)